MNCNDLYGGVVRHRGSTSLTTIVPRQQQGAEYNCPHTHPYSIPGSNCCAEGRDLFYYKERQPAKKHVITFEGAGGEQKRRNRDDDDGDMSDFGKTRKFKHFRTAYKRSHPHASEHRILVKYTSALLRMRLLTN